MLAYLEKRQTLIAVIIIVALLVTLLFLPDIVQITSILVLSISISLTVLFVIRKHWQTYQQAECTREKMVRNIFLDLLGLLFTMGAAMYGGRLAGGYFGVRSGFWVGMFAGFIGGFAAAWMVRFVWVKVSKKLA